MRVVVIEPNKLPYAKSIENSLGTMQKIVGGYIQVVGIMNKYCLICNEEGKILDLEPNRYIDELRDVIFGTFFITGPADAEGDFTSLSDDDINFLIDKFSDVQVT